MTAPRFRLIKAVGYSAALTLNTGSFADFLEVLQLDPVLDGTGTFSAQMLNQGGKLHISDTQTVIDLSEGQRLEASGSIGDLISGDDVDIKLVARLHPEGAPPPTAREIADLKLTAARVELVGDRGKLELREMYFGTNAFEQGLDSLGTGVFGSIWTYRRRHIVHSRHFHSSRSAGRALFEIQRGNQQPA